MHLPRQRIIIREFAGSGCRDLRGSKDPKRRLSIPAQTKNPAIGGYNATLIRNFETGNPVRVIRGYKLNSKFAPYRGYRYDGNLIFFISFFRTN